MANLTTIRLALASVIGAAVPNVNVSPYYVQQVNPPQFVIDTLPLVEDFATLDGSVDFGLRIILVASLADEASGQSLLDGWLASDGAGSVVAAIQGNPRLVVNSAPACDYCVVSRIGAPGAAGGRSGYGLMEWAGQAYLATQILLDIAASQQ